MVDIPEAFEAVVGDFIDSAETEEQLTLFMVIATAAWNLSLHAEDKRADFVQGVIDRFQCPSFTWKGKVIDTREKILELCERKIKMHPDLKRMIRNLEVEDAEEGLKYSIASEPVE